MHAEHIPSTADFSTDRNFAERMDAADTLRPFREQFCIPKTDDGNEVIYLAGNSLGLLPKTVAPIVERELEDWGRLAVDAHFDGRQPWYGYHEQFRESAARIVGALPTEVVLMNSLTVNLHLMMVSFYRPTVERFKIITDWPSFPSDIYAVDSQIRHHGFDPGQAFIKVGPRDGEHVINMDDLAAQIEAHGSQAALVMVSGVNYYTGQFYDLKRLTDAAHRAGCMIGIDLAHAAGNVPLSLHEWDVDFAVWCNYKYLNSGPGTVGGCFVHERHAKNQELNRFAGWWGNDPKRRFIMHLQPEFVPMPKADGWQVSNPPILAMAAIRGSYDLFDQTTIATLREKSQRLTGYLEFLIDEQGQDRFELITPRDPNQRGCQLSILAKDRPKALFDALHKANAVGDFREPNVIRIAPVPMYNSFMDVWRFAQILVQAGGGDLDG
ncbi:MAG: kynureninase [Phycisphaerae bacterium]|nr:MAG: kynureninase [Phycisphaerae bacterium]